MSDLEFSERPQLRRSILIAAFSGWPDASEAATGAIKFLINALSASQFARIDAEEFFDFTKLRPDISICANDRRVIDWPTNYFYYVKHQESDGRDIILLNGAEPHLKWKRFAKQMMQIITDTNVDAFILLGAQLDAVPHTRAPRITSSATNEPLSDGFDEIEFGPSTYEGPTAASSIILEYLADRDIPSLSIWGHAPHYLQASSNPELTHAILSTLRTLLPIELDLSDLEHEAAEFSRNVDVALRDETEVSAYVQRLEKRFDSEIRRTEETNDFNDVIQDLEGFLKRSRQPGSNQGDN